MNTQKKDDDGFATEWVGYGMMGGVIIGLATDNLALWLAIGLAIGAGLASRPGGGSEKADQN